MIVVVMGVSGVGKSTVGGELAARLNCDFLDADDYHSAENKAKMHAGIPLTDADRLPWLRTLNKILQEHEQQQKSAVLACSALKDSYRDLLETGVTIKWVYLKGSPEVIRERLQERHGHFAGETLLTSQLATLEEPANAIVVNADQPVEDIMNQLLPRLS
ncbi:MAG TPA: gluconokinase [Terriglobales bacterium]|nr:gluconokinase [Terriglobales bacterium]